MSENNMISVEAAAKVLGVYQNLWNKYLKLLWFRFRGATNKCMDEV
jgi:hypothetical protein